MKFSGSASYTIDQQENQVTIFYPTIKYIKKDNWTSGTFKIAFYNLDAPIGQYYGTKRTIASYQFKNRLKGGDYERGGQLQLVLQNKPTKKYFALVLYELSQGQYQRRDYINFQNIKKNHKKIKSQIKLPIINNRKNEQLISDSDEQTNITKINYFSKNKPNQYQFVQQNYNYYNQNYYYYY